MQENRFDALLTAAYDAFFVVYTNQDATPAEFAGTTQNLKNILHTIEQEASETWKNEHQSKLVICYKLLESALNASNTRSLRQIAVQSSASVPVQINRQNTTNSLAAARDTALQSGPNLIISSGIPSFFSGVTTNVPQIEGLEYQAVPGDGSCFYHAVSLYLGRAQEGLRQDVANYLKVNIEKFQAVIHLAEGQTIGNYLDGIRNGREWADNIEIEALMRVLDRPIVVIGPEGEIRNRDQVQRFKGEPIFVYYNGHSHYDGYFLTQPNVVTAHAILVRLERLRDEASNSANICQSTDVLNTEEIGGFLRPISANAVQGMPNSPAVARRTIMQDISNLPTPLEYVYFCYLAYQDIRTQTDTLVAGWKRHNKYEITDNFEAMVFQQDDSKQLVIAFKGYLPNIANFDIIQLITTIQSFFATDATHIQKYIQHANRVYKEIYENFPTYRITFTGHGLGAVLAEIMAVHHDRYAVTFDSSGSKAALESLYFTQFERAKNLVISYFSSPNLLNTLNEQIASHRFLLNIPRNKVPEQSSWARHLFMQLLGGPLIGTFINAALDITGELKAMWEITLYQYDIAHHLLAFNPHTGQPRKFSKIHEWPTLGQNVVTNFAARLSTYMGNERVINGLTEAYGGHLIEHRMKNPFTIQHPRSNVNSLQFYKLTVLLANAVSLLGALTYAIQQGFTNVPLSFFFAYLSISLLYCIYKNDALTLNHQAQTAQFQAEQLEIACAEKAIENPLLTQLPAWRNYQYHSMTFFQQAAIKPIIPTPIKILIESLGFVLFSGLLIGIDFIGKLASQEKAMLSTHLLYLGSFICIVANISPYFIGVLKDAATKYENALRAWSDEPNSESVRIYSRPVSS